MHLFTRAFLGVILAVAGLAALPHAARAQDGAMIVLDASATMMGSIGGKSKIQIARDTLATVLADPPAKLALGMLVFGHRQKASCTDIDLMVPPAVGSTKAILDAAATIKPQGKTPLADSLNEAAQELNYGEKKATIIVIADGSDNCEGDPCAAASDLKSTGADFTIHVVGFGLSDADKKKLVCLSDITGGLFLDAASASDLSDALTKAVKLEPEVPLPAASVQAPDSIEAASDLTVAYEGPKEDGDQIQIAWAGSRPGQNITSVRVTGDGKPAHFLAPSESGDYEVRYWLPSRGKVIAQRPLRVTEAAVKLRVPESIGRGAEFEVAWSGHVDLNGVIEIVPQNGGAPLSGARLRDLGGTVKLDAPPTAGTYTLRYRVADNTLATAALTVSESDVGFDVPANIAGGSDFVVKWKGPAAYYDEIQLASPSTADGSRIEYARASDPSEPVTLSAPLQAGKYEVRYWSSRGRSVLARTTVDVSSVSATVDAPGSVAGSAPISVAWTGPGSRFDEIQIAPANAAPGDAVARADVGEGPVTLAAPAEAGDYEIRYWSGAWRATLARRNLSVSAPSASLSVAGAVTAGAKFSVTWQGPAGRYDDIRVAAPGSAPDAAIHAARVGAPGTPVEVLAPKEPGTYQLRYWSDRARKVLATIDVVVQ
jgi:Ca-activated chloride channel family protein